MISKIPYTDRNDWLEKRRGYIGGSDAGAVAGFNPYRGPYAVWLDKTGKAMGADKPSVAAELGSFLEQFVADKFAAETGKKVQRVNFIQVNDLYPWACADIDRRVVGEDAILECKTTSSFENQKLIASGEYPMAWYCQMMHYMAVTGALKAYLAVLIGNRDFRIFELERDNEEIASLMRIEYEFWQHVEDETPPAASAEDEQAVSEYGSAVSVQDETPLDLSAETALLQEYSEAREAAEEADRRVKELKNRICAALGEYTNGTAPGFRVSWTPQVRKTFDAKKFAAANPGLDLAPYYKPSTSRVFKFATVE